MFAKLKKKIAEETAITQRPGGGTRIARSVSKESVASMGADSGDDFASDGSSSREDLSSQLLRRNEQIRKLEARLSDYAEQVRNLQKIKEKLEIALEKHQDSSMRKFQEQNETFQANRAKMAEGLALALARKDQEWSEKVDQLEKEKSFLTAQLQEMKNQSLNLFQRRDEMDELEEFQQQELSKVKHMLLKKEESLEKMEQELEARTRELSHTQEELRTSSQRSSDLSQKLEELQRHYSTLEEQRDHVTASKMGAENKLAALEQKEQELQACIQQLSIDLQKVTAETQEKEKLITHLQEKVTSLERRLEQNLSGEEYVQELLKEKTVAEQNLEDTRQQLLAARSSQAKAIDVLETRVKDLEQSLRASEEKLKESAGVAAAREAQIQELAAADKESSRAQQQALALQQQCAEHICVLEAQLAALEQARAADQAAAEHKARELEQENTALKQNKNECELSLQHHQLELKKLKEEWSQREIVSVAMAQALEEVRKQREELQQQAAHLTALVDEKELSVREKAEALLQKEQEILQLKKGHDAALLHTHQLQAELEALRSRRAEESEAAAVREGLLRLPGRGQGLALSDGEPRAASRAVQDPAFRLPAAEGIPNGEVGATDLGRLQEEKQDLEQQLLEKNKVRMPLASAISISAQSLLRVLPTPLGTSRGGMTSLLRGASPRFPRLLPRCLLPFTPPPPVFSPAPHSTCHQGIRAWAVAGLGVPSHLRHHQLGHIGHILSPYQRTSFLRLSPSAVPSTLSAVPSSPSQALWPCLSVNIKHPPASGPSYLLSLLSKRFSPQLPSPP